MKFKGHLRSTFEVRYICLITAEVKCDLNINLLCRYKSINTAKPLPMISGQQFIMYKTLVSKVLSNIGKESLSHSTFWFFFLVCFYNFKLNICSVVPRCVLEAFVLDVC